MIETAVNQGYTERAAFLIWMGSHFSAEAEIAKGVSSKTSDPYVDNFGDPAIDALKLDQIIKNFPSYHTKFVTKEEVKEGKLVPIEELGIDLILKTIEDPKTGIEGQMDLSTYLLELMASHPDGSELDKIDFLKDNKNVAKLLIQETSFAKSFKNQLLSCGKQEHLNLKKSLKMGPV